MFDELSSDQLVEELATQAAHVSAGIARLVELATACGERVPLALDGSSFPGWLAWRCGVLPREARAVERVGKALAELPLIRAAFSRGELSFAKVQTLTRIAAPGSEERLLELAAVLTASQLERSVGAFRQLTKEQAADQQADEFLHYFWTDEGLLSL